MFYFFYKILREQGNYLNTHWTARRCLVNKFPYNKIIVVSQTTRKSSLKLTLLLIVLDSRQCEHLRFAITRAVGLWDLPYYTLC